jgi:aspartyl-tRNA(Asn)/glutamyl-tRNA(Gln) amidotransferase subunit A
MADADLFFAAIPELNAKLASGQISAVELTRAFAQRLERLGPRYNALALSLSDQAVQQAKDVDKDLKRGRTRGRLQGIPYGVKDLLAFAGKPTTWGARPYANQVFDYNAAAIDKLSGAGAILAGKLAMVQLAGGGGYRYAAASLTGPGLNPWDRTRWAGGSSSGSAAAVAAGLLPFALGSETAGSIVTPASYCGVTALRPTYGLVSRYGAMTLSWTLDKLGPFARSAEDCGLILQAISGNDGRDAGSAGKTFYYAPQYARPIREMRIGYAAADFAERPEAAARPAFAAALDVFRQAGAQLVETGLPQLPYSQVLSIVLAAEQGAVFEPLISGGRVEELADQAQIAVMKASLEVPAKDYLRAMRIRAQIQRELRRLFEDLDAVIAPGRYGGATAIEQPLLPLAGVEPPEAPAPPAGAAGFARLIQAGNLAGLPALVLPCGFAGGLPVAMQVVGAPFTEGKLLGIGCDFQSRTDWHKRRPPEA